MNEIYKMAAELLAKKDKIIIAIDGAYCSGKTYMADLIAKNIDCNVFHTKDFILPADEAGLRPNDVVGIDVPRFRAEVLEKLGVGGPFDYGKYDRDSGTYYKTVVTCQKPVNVVEGAYSLCEELDGYYDIKIFLKADGVTSAKRREEAGKYFAEDIAREERYFEKQRPMDRADFVGRLAREGDFIRLPL